MFFQLFPYCKFVRGENGGSLYNMASGDIYELDEHHINALESNSADEDLYPIYKELADNGLGQFFEEKPFVQPLYWGAGDIVAELVEGPHSIYQVQIQLDNDCELDCWFCKNAEDLAIKRDGCYRWSKSSKKQQIDWENVLLQCKKLGGSVIYITYTSEKSKYELKSIIEIASKLKYSHVYIYTNGFGIDHNFLDSLASVNEKIKLSWIIQIVSLDDAELKKLCGDNASSSILMGTLQLLSAYNEDILPHIVIGKANEAFIDDVIRKLSAIGLNALSYDDLKNSKNSYLAPERKHATQLERVNYFNVSLRMQKNECLNRNICIFADGLVAPCIMLRNFPVGSVFSEKIVDMIKSTPYTEITHISKETLKPCSRCSKKYGCFDCRAIEISLTGDLYHTACEEFGHE